MDMYTETADSAEHGAPNAADPSVRDAIERRARELWEQRGRVEGHADEDWLQAESEVLEALASAPAIPPPPPEPLPRAIPAYIQIRAGNFIYIGEYDLARCDCYKPGDLPKGAPIAVRFDRGSMYVKLPGGRELKTRLVRKVKI